MVHLMHILICPNTLSCTWSPVPAILVYSGCHGLTTGGIPNSKQMPTESVQMTWYALMQLLWK
jgi:hypothetical protein